MSQEIDGAGTDLLAAFGHQRALVGPHRCHDFDELMKRIALDIELGAGTRLEMSLVVGLYANANHVAMLFMRFGGGCQGCGMATVTLGQGIEVAMAQLCPK